ncbi:MAG: PhoU domain-containing protein [Candidatus Bathyarchaeota archaeon]
MSRPLDVGISQIKTLLIKMGKLSRNSTKFALDHFFKGEEAYTQVRAWSNTVQLMAEEVEDRATELIALHQPMAGDLRILKAYIKIAYDLERYGRYAMDVSEIQYRLGEWKPLEENDLKVKELVDKTIQVMDMSLTMIETMDEKMIFDLSKVETETDDLYFENMRRLSECKGDPKTVVAYMLTIRYLERLADHGSYIAESISYAATGKRISIR